MRRKFDECYEQTQEELERAHVLHGMGIMNDELRLVIGIS